MMPNRQLRIALITLVTREIRRFMRIWVQTLVPPAITVVLYIIIFGNLIGSRIGEMEGFDYIEFVVPGLIMMGVITNAYSNVVSSFYSARFQRSIEELLVSPVPNYIILWGYLSGGIARGLLVGLIVTLLSLFFTSLQLHNFAVTIVVVVLTSLLFAQCGFINAVFADSFDDISIIPTFVLTPLIYLGGVFYSVSLLPDFWELVSRLNPVLYMVNAFRYGILGISDIDIRWAFVMIIAFNLVAYCYCIYLLRSGKKLRL
jgi:ABC-2 type transport system permease protein